jgi:hypothetical protein
MPFSEEAMDLRVIDLIDTSDTLPDLQSGYDSLRTGFDSGKAGVFSITAAEAIDFMITNFGQ